MPVGYVVSPNGRTGAELRIARDIHELVATGTSARLGKLLPHILHDDSDYKHRPEGTVT